MTKDNTMRNIDWSRPLEALRKSDGKAVDVTLDDHRSFCGFRYTKETPDPDETNDAWRDDGGDVCSRNLWFLRNKDEPKADIPEWAIKRAHQLCDDSGDTWPQAFARYIAKHEGPPVDPAILKARELAKPWIGFGNASIDAGYHDDTPVIKAVVEAIQFGRELERGEVK